MAGPKLQANRLCDPGQRHCSSADKHKGEKEMRAVPASGPSTPLVWFALAGPNPASRTEITNQSEAERLPSHSFLRKN